MTTAVIAFVSCVMAPHVEMREKPTADSEVVSDAYFSEQISVLEENGDWVKIETAVDKYQGWVRKAIVHQNSEEYFSSTTAKVNRRVAHLYDRKDTVYGPILDLPFESRLKVLDSQDPRWIQVQLPDNRIAFIQRGCIAMNPTPLNKSEIVSLSQDFLGIDYMWGGRSSFGYDCSGFVQMLYRQMGIHLPRDSKDQIKWDGFTECLREKLEPGDVVFFGLEQDKIRHVGLYIGNGRFIHSTVAENKPWIRISNLDEPEWNGQGRYKYPAFRTLR